MTLIANVLQAPLHSHLALFHGKLGWGILWIKQLLAY